MAYAELFAAIGTESPAGEEETDGNNPIRQMREAIKKRDRELLEAKRKLQEIERQSQQRQVEAQAAIVRLSGTFGNIGTVTAQVTSGSNLIVVSDGSNIRQGMFLNVGTLQRVEVLSIKGNDVELSSNATVTSPSVSVTYAPPVFSKVLSPASDF